MDHIDATYNSPNEPPTDSEWQEFDSMVILWFFGSISQSLITSAHSTPANARKVNVHSIFYNDQEATVMQLDT